MLRAARFSIPLTILSDSQYALGVVLGEDRALVQLARSEERCFLQRAGIDGRHVAAHRGLAGNEAADRLADAGRRRWMVPKRAAGFISLASSIPPKPELKSFFLLFLNPALVPNENSMEDPLCDSSFGSMVSLDYVTPDTEDSEQQ